MCEQIIEALSTLEPGISNSIANVNFELCVAKIAKIKQQIALNILSKSDAENLVAIEVKNARGAFEILTAGSEGKSQLESRLQRLIAQSSTTVKKY